MNDKQKAQALLSMTLDITRLKSNLNNYPDLKRKLSRQIKALDEIDEAVGRKAGSKRLGGNPIDLDIVIGSRAIEKSVTNPSPNNERTPTGV